VSKDKGLFVSKNKGNKNEGNAVVRVKEKAVARTKEVDKDKGLDSKDKDSNEVRPFYFAFIYVVTYSKERIESIIMLRIRYPSTYYDFVDDTLLD
jgi:hypothetical protein